MLYRPRLLVFCRGRRGANSRLLAFSLGIAPVHRRTGSARPPYSLVDTLRNKQVALLPLPPPSMAR